MPKIKSQMNWIDKIYQDYDGNVGVETLEVEINNTTGIYSLPDNSLLRSHRVLGVFVADNASDDRYSPSSGRQLVTQAALRNASLTLKCNNVTVLDNVPLMHCATTLNDHRVHPLKSSNLTPDQSSVRFGNPGTVLSTGRSLLLHFYYQM